MAKFEGVKWAPRQMRYLVFEGIRFFCHRNPGGEIEAVFLNWHLNLERFRNGIAFNLSGEQQELVPTADELENVFIRLYLKDPSMRRFLEEMAELGAQGYLRPFTFDEEQSIGVTFPAQPSVRAMACRYDRYLGEPFCGVVVPNLVRAVGINKTGCLKLGINYLMSVKAVDEAKKLCPEAACALFLDDNPLGNLLDRHVTEWDSSCCLFGLRDGTVIKIPESPLILPSVTIHGVVAILKEMGVAVKEHHLAYGELIEKARSGELAVAASVGTAGILNRCARLILADDKGEILATHSPDVKHPLFQKLGEAREYYWKIYKEAVKIPAGLRLSKYVL